MFEFCLTFLSFLLFCSNFYVKIQKYYLYLFQSFYLATLVSIVISNTVFLLQAQKQKVAARKEVLQSLKKVNEYINLTKCLQHLFINSSAAFEMNRQIGGGVICVLCFKRLLKKRLANSFIGPFFPSKLVSAITV